jgi:hypothetical protein
MLDHQLVDGGLLDQPALLLLAVATVATFALSAHDICGQFVDRILSTQPITNGKKWERM